MSEYDEYENHEEFHEQDTGPSYEDFINAQKISVQDVMEHITGPVISVIVHIIAIAFLGTIVVFKAPKEGSDIAVEVTEMEVKEMEKIPEPPEPPEEVQEEIEVEIDRPDVETDSVDVDVEDVAVEDVSTNIAMPTNLAIKTNNSALRFSGVYGSRSAGRRKTAIKQYGGSSSTERSVSKALKWLASVQNPDGSWGDKAPYRPAMTGLATLAFLAHGETPNSQEYGTTILKAIRKLIEMSETANSKGLIRNAGNGYGNAIVAYALSESYALTRIPMVEKAMNRLIDGIVKGQNKLGSYNYSFGNKAPVKDKEGKILYNGDPRSDLSVAGWNYQALKAGFAAGSDVAGLPEAIDKGINAIKKVHGGYKNGTFSYSANYGKGGAGSGTPSMTAVGTLCLQLFGAGKSSAARKGVKWMEEYTLRDKRGKPLPPLTMYWKKPSNWSLYTWYYKTQALFQGSSGKGRSWKKWNRSFTKTLMREQSREGYWDSPMDKYGEKEHIGHGECSKIGPIDPKTKKPRRGIYSTLECRIYSTALCTMMLEVYYRYLPSFKVVHHSGGGGSGGGGDDDDNIDGLIIE